MPLALHVRTPLTQTGALFLLQHFDFPLPSPLKVFEMLVVPEQEYPLVCVAISQGSELGQVVRFETINLNSCSSWFTEIGTSRFKHVVETNSHEVSCCLSTECNAASRLCGFIIRLNIQAHNL